MTEVARHWIDGSWLESALVAYSYNPATGELRGSFADGGDGEARAAVEAARAAFEVTDWGHDRRLRSRVLLELAELFEARAPALALMLTQENGKTLAQATGEVGAPALRPLPATRTAWLARGSLSSAASPIRCANTSRNS